MSNAKGPSGPDAFKIAFIDIETAPNLGYTWGKYEQNVLKFTQECFMLSYSVKWAGSNKVITKALIDYPEYTKNTTDDFNLVYDFWHVLDEADLVVAHNGDKFDLRKANTRFVAHDIMPPHPYKTVDTLKLARKYFAFNSNRLGDLAKFLGLSAKLDSGDFSLWLGCLGGDKKAWATMKKYNAQDVVVLEEVYNTLRAWNTNPPNINIKTNNVGCPVCGSDNLQKRGYAYTATMRAQRYRCLDCGHWSRGSNEKLKVTHLK